MKNKFTYDLFLPSGCLSAGSMKLHASGNLPGKDHELVNAHLQSCELCSDAYEGMKGISDEASYDRAISAIKQDFKKRLFTRKTILPRNKKLKRVHTHRYFSYIAMAAAVLAIFMVYNFMKARENQTKIFGEQFAENSLYEPLPALPEEKSEFIAMEQSRETAKGSRVKKPEEEQAGKPPPPVTNKDILVVEDDMVLEDMEEQEEMEIMMDEMAAMEELVVEPAEDQEMAYAQVAGKDENVFVEKSISREKEEIFAEEKSARTVKGHTAKKSAMGTPPVVTSLEEAGMKSLIHEFYHQEYQETLSDTLKDTINIRFYLGTDYTPSNIIISGTSYPHYYRAKIVDLFNQPQFLKLIKSGSFPVSTSYDIDFLELALPVKKDR